MANLKPLALDPATGFPRQVSSSDTLDASVKSRDALGIPMRPSGLDQWFTKYAAATAAAPVDVVVIGDSIWDLGPGNQDPSPHNLLSRLLNEAAGVKGADAVPSTLPSPVHAQTSGAGANASPTATSTQGTRRVASLGSQGSTLTNGQVLYHTTSVPCTSWALAYRTDPSYGTMTIRDGAGGTVLATISCAATAQSGNVWTSGTLSDAVHTLHITSSGTTCPEILNPQRGNKVRLWPCCLAGQTSAIVTSTPEFAFGLLATLQAAGTLGAVLIATGVNDTLATEVGDLATAVATYTTADRLLWAPYQNAGYLLAEYELKRPYFLSTTLPVVDSAGIADNLGTLDGTHPDAVSRYVIATQVMATLSGDPIGTAYRFATQNHIKGRGTNYSKLDTALLTLGGDWYFGTSGTPGRFGAGTNSLAIAFGVPDGSFAGAKYGFTPQTSDPAGPNYVGDVAMVNGVLRRCTVAGTPGTWVDAFIIPVAGDLGTGFAYTMPPTSVTTSTGAVSASRGYWMRATGRATGITGIDLYVGTSSGNISVAVYGGNGSTGKAARPGARKATSGAVACPAVGSATVALATFDAGGSNINIEPVDWFFVSADNATATLGRGTVSYTLTDGYSYFKSASHPAPSGTPTGLTTSPNVYFALAG